MDIIDAHEGVAGACGCCGYHASETLLNSLTIAMVERGALDYAGLTRVLREESNDAPYVPAEVSLTSLLAEHASDVADRIEAPLIAALAGTYVNVDAILTAGNRVRAEWEAEAWPSTLEAKAGKLISGASLAGAHNVSFGAPLLSDLDRLRIVNGMVRSAKYTTNNYFNTQVMPALADAAHAAVLNGTANDVSELAAIRNMLDRRLRSVPYWNLVANAAASRAYHFGFLKVGQAAGRRTATFWNPNDEKTSAMCRALFGMQWSTDDLVDLVDRIADARDTDIVKEITPWYKPKEIEGKTADELLSMGCAIPPIHGRCRSELRFD